MSLPLDKEETRSMRWSDNALLLRKRRSVFRKQRNNGNASVNSPMQMLKRRRRWKRWRRED
jgi:hypothetical protein